MVILITKINWEEKGNKYILDIFNNHKNSSTLVYYLLFILNKEKNDKENIISICKLISDLMDLTKSSLFYKNDLDSFISVSIQILESTYTDKLRYNILNILNKITSFSDYFESKYKLDILEDLLDNYLYSDSVGEENKVICSQIIENIHKFS